MVCNLGRFVEFCDLDRNLGADVRIDIEVAVPESVVQEHAVVLGDGRWTADDVHDGDLLRVSARNAVDRRQLAHAEGGDQGSDALDASIAVSRVCLMNGVSIPRNSPTETR